MNKEHQFCFYTNISPKECFTFRQAMKRLDRILFVATTEKYINPHGEGNHLMIIQRSSIPETVKTIKSIWSFKRKRKPDGRLLKLKAQIFDHGGMTQWAESYWETYYTVVYMLIVQILLCIENTQFILKVYPFCVGVYSS